MFDFIALDRAASLCRHFNRHFPDNWEPGILCATLKVEPVSANHLDEFIAPNFHYLNLLWWDDLHMDDLHIVNQMCARVWSSAVNIRRSISPSWEPWLLDFQSISGDVSQPHSYAQLSSLKEAGLKWEVGFQFIIQDVWTASAIWWMLIQAFALATPYIKDLSWSRWNPVLNKVCAFRNFTIVECTITH